MTPAAWFALLTAAEAVWKPAISVHAPWFLWSAPTLMTTSDGGLTYSFTGAITPLRVEVYDAKTNGALLRPCTFWDTDGYVWEGNRLRWPRGQTHVFTDGAPYARFIAPSGTIDATTQPTLQPDYARILLVYNAAAAWASRGGLRDPSPFERLEQRSWYSPSDGTGILVQLKVQNPFIGASAWGDSDVPITSHLATLDGGYTSL